MQEDVGAGCVLILFGIVGILHLINPRVLLRYRLRWMYARPESPEAFERLVASSRIPTIGAIIFLFAFGIWLLVEGINYDSRKDATRQRGKPIEERGPNGSDRLRKDSGGGSSKPGRYIPYFVN